MRKNVEKARGRGPLRSLLTSLTLLVLASGLWAQGEKRHSGGDVVELWSADVEQQTGQKLENAQRTAQIFERLRAPEAERALVTSVSSWPEAYVAALYTQAMRRGFFPDRVDTRPPLFQLAPAMPPKRVTDALQYSFVAGTNSLPYEVMIRSVLRSEGIPVELIAVPQVESGFNPLALSPKGVGGSGS